MSTAPKRAPRWQWAIGIATALLLPVALAVTCVESTAGYGPPRILKQAERDWPRDVGESQKLTHALARQFPNGTRVDAMKAELLREGFRAQDPSTLSYGWDETTCVNSVSVTWTADKSGRLTGIVGRTANTCL
ncbi:MAG TPA: hypothetical protein VHU87_04845 [Rhizomicrobium sp.]|jgi:hypothetical protein|nr:hypothetical protein [Rhizomicrobium sp.]